MSARSKARWHPLRAGQPHQLQKEKWLQHVSSNLRLVNMHVSTGFPINPPSTPLMLNKMTCSFFRSVWCQNNCADNCYPVLPSGCWGFLWLSSITNCYDHIVHLGLFDSQFFFFFWKLCLLTSFEWVLFWCLALSDALEKALLQPSCSHTYGFSPVWDLKCVFKFSSLE